MQGDLQIILSVGREDVGLCLREDVQVVMIFLWNFGVEKGIKRGDGKKGRERGWEKREG